MVSDSIVVGGAAGGVVVGVNSTVLVWSLLRSLWVLLFAVLFLPSFLTGAPSTPATYPVLCSPSLAFPVWCLNICSGGVGPPSVALLKAHSLSSWFAQLQSVQNVQFFTGSGDSEGQGWATVKPASSM